MLGRAAGAQSVDGAAPAATAAPSPAVAPLPAAGVIPATLALDVTGTPAIDGDVLDTQIRAALDREIRPTLQPGAAVRYGPIVPWPLLPLALAARAAVNVTVTIEGDASSAPLSGVTTVTLSNVPVAPVPARVLFLSDDPEYLQSEGLVFRGDVTADRPARLYYYHSDTGVPRDLEVVLTATLRSRVHLVTSAGGPELDVMNVGHTVSRDFLRFMQANEGRIVDIEPGKPFVLRHALLLQGEVIAGAADIRVVSGGAVAISVVAAPAGGHSDTYLRGPRVAYDAHSRHGTFDLDGYGTIAQSYTAGGPDVAVQYGRRVPSPRNLDPHDAGHDYGDYGVVQRITFMLSNPSDSPSLVHLYEKPLGGPVRSSFLIDGALREVGCVRLSQPYWVASYQLPPHSTGASTTLTMTDGGSFYPIEYGVTSTQPQTSTPPVGAPEGCSPNPAPFAQPSPVAVGTSSP